MEREFLQPLLLINYYKLTKMSQFSLLTLHLAILFSIKSKSTCTWIIDHDNKTTEQRPSLHKTFHSPFINLTPPIRWPVKSLWLHISYSNCNIMNKQWKSAVVTLHFMLWLCLNLIIINYILITLITGGMRRHHAQIHSGISLGL